MTPIRPDAGQREPHMPTQTRPPRSVATVPPLRLPATPPRPRVRRRERVRGIAAALVLLLVIVGVPCGLVLGVGRPVHHLPSREWLTQPLDANAIIAVLAVVVWIVWAHFTVCVIAEWRSETRGAASPPHIPLGGFTQLSARKLVAAVLLLVGVATMGAGQASSSVIAHRVPAAVSSAFSGHSPSANPIHEGANATTGATAATSAPAAALAVTTTQVYDVHAPVGRNYDTLWGISERYLGDGRRYKEIFAANQGRIQPDGAVLTKPDLIRPGWILVMPADAKGPGLRAIDPLPIGAAPTTTSPHATPQSTPHANPQVNTHTSTASAAGARSPSGIVGATHHDSLGLAHGGPGGSPLNRIGDDLLGGSLVAAGLLLALRRKRGAFSPVPLDSDAATEARLRLAADEPSARFVDTALRSLSTSLRDLGRGLPDVYAAVLDAEALVVRCVTAQPAPPTPWSADDARTWRLRRSDAAKLTAEPAALAPYPTLAVLGHSADSLVLLDFEAARGIVALGGDLHIARDIAAHLAVELATNTWSDDAVVTMVGFGDELSALAPGRLRHEATLQSALDEAEQRLAAARPIYADGVGSVLRGRQLHADRSRHRPHALVLSGPPAADDAARLAALAGDEQAPLAVIVVGDVRDARWRLIASAPDALDVPVLALHLRAATLRPEFYRPVIELFESAASSTNNDVLAKRTVGGGFSSSGFEHDELGEQPVAYRRDELLDPVRQWPVDVRVLGPVSVAAPGGLERSRHEQAAEIVVFLALRPEGAHPNVLQAAIWPRGVQPQVMAAALAHVQGWLGNAADGLPRMRQDEAGRWRLTDGVRLDWDVLRTHVAHAIEGASDDETQLAAAIALIRGPAWENPPSGSYAWLAHEAAQHEIPATVVSIAHRASALALARGDADASIGYARAGLSMCAGAELLWRDVLQGAARQGRDQLAAAAQQWWTTVAPLRIRDSSAAQTDALLAELLPGFKPAA